MFRTLRKLGLQQAIFVVLLFIVRSSKADYVVTTLVDTTQKFAYIGTPSMNDEGDVAFFARMNTGSTGIFRARGGAITRIARVPLLDNEGVVFPAIDSKGRVVFDVQFPGGTGVFSGKGGALTTVAVSTDSTFSFLYTPTINDAGQVAFWAHRDGGGGNGIYLVERDGTLKVVASKRGTPPATRGNRYAKRSINDRGTVTFKVALGPEFDDQGIATSRNGVTKIRVAAKDAGLRLNPYVQPVINNTGDIAFAASRRDADGVEREVVSIVSEGVVTTVATTPFEFVREVSINDLASVAFFAVAGSVFGIFTGPDPAADKVVASGDTLFDSTVADVRFESDALNNSGQIALRYELASGIHGIGIATPVP